MPSRLIMIMHGAYSPIPRVISAPRRSCRQPRSAVSRRGRRSIAAAREQLNWRHEHENRGREQCEPHAELDVPLRPARDDAGAQPGAETAATINAMSVTVSTGMIDVKMKAWATVGRVWPAFSVPE